MTITESAQRKVDQTLNGEGFLGVHLEGGETIFSDATSLELLGDAVMDWDSDPFRPSFHFTPPTGSQSCGCGNSFTV